MNERLAIFLGAVAVALLFLKMSSHYRKQMIRYIEEDDIDNAYVIRPLYYLTGVVGSLYGLIVLTFAVKTLFL